MNRVSADVRAAVGSEALSRAAHRPAAAHLGHATRPAGRRVASHLRAYRGGTLREVVPPAPAWSLSSWLVIPLVDRRGSTFDL